jgi:hypothetical protein
MRQWSFSGVHKLSGNSQPCFAKLRLVPIALWKAGHRQGLLNKAAEFHSLKNEVALALQFQHQQLQQLQSCIAAERFCYSFTPDHRL